MCYLIYFIATMADAISLWLFVTLVMLGIAWWVGVELNLLTDVQTGNLGWALFGTLIAWFFFCVIARVDEASEPACAHVFPAEVPEPLYPGASADAGPDCR